MKTSSFVLAAAAIALTTMPVRAQSPLRVTGVGQVQVTVVAQLVMPKVLQLDAEPGQARVRTVDGVHEQDDAVTLYVSANRGWRLAVSGLSENVEVLVEPETTRATAVSDEFESASGTQEVARGAKGTRIPLRVHFRWRGSTPPSPVYSLIDG